MGKNYDAASDPNNPDASFYSDIKGNARGGAGVADTLYSDDGRITHGDTKEHKGGWGRHEKVSMGHDKGEFARGLESVGGAIVSGAIRIDIGGGYYIDANTNMVFDESGNCHGQSGRAVV